MIKCRFLSALLALALITPASAGLVVQQGSPRYSITPGGELYSGFTPTHYAAPTDQGAGDCTSEVNACDLAQGLAAIDDDDVLGMLPGDYAGTPTGDVIFQPTNSGSSGSPVRIAAKYPALYYHSTPAQLSAFCSNDPNLVDLNDNTPVLGASGLNYIEIYGPYLDQSCAPPRPSHGTMYVNGCTGCVLADFVSDEIEIDQPDSDNWNTLFVNSSTGLVVRNFLIRGTGVSGPENHNASGITTYGTLEFTIERATFDGVNHAIFIKGSAAGNTRGNSGTIRRIKCDGTDKGCVTIAVVRGSSEAVGNRVVVEDVLSLNDGVNGNAAIHFAPDGEGSRYVDFRHNTIVAGSTGGGVYGNSTVQEDMTFRDNVIYFSASTSQHPLNLEGVPASAYTTLDYNLYSEQGQTAVFAMELSTYSGLALWQTATSKEANSDESVPTFVDSGAGDYRLSGDTGSSTGGARGIRYAPSEIGAPGS